MWAKQLKIFNKDYWREGGYNASKKWDLKFFSQAHRPNTFNFPDHLKIDKI